jgi:hypothetical protein
MYIEEIASNFYTKFKINTKSVIGVTENKFETKEIQ